MHKKAEDTLQIFCLKTFLPKHETSKLTSLYTDFFVLLDYVIVPIILLIM